MPRGAMADPVKGVQEPEYVREKVAIPSLAYVKKALLVADEDLALEIAMMAGCSLRNGEARVVNVNSVVARDVSRVREQIHSNTLRPAKLKHRKVGEFREAPLSRSVRETIERYEAKLGTTSDGYLLRGPGGYFTEGMERRRVKKLFANLPAEEGAGMYGLPALLRLERSRKRDPHHRRSGMDGPQVHRGDVPDLPAPAAGEYQQGRSGPGWRPLGSGLRSWMEGGGARGRRCAAGPSLSHGAERCGCPRGGPVPGPIGRSVVVDAVGREDRDFVQDVREGLVSLGLPVASRISSCCARCAIRVGASTAEGGGGRAGADHGGALAVVPGADDVVAPEGKPRRFGELMDALGGRTTPEA